jgi:UTP--glucose-1-phosphate uridylyltransferase
VFAPSIFDALQRTSPGKGGEIQLTDAIRIAIREGGRVYGMCLSAQERRFDVGNFDSYFRAFVEFALADRKHGPALRETLRRLLDAPRP